MHYDAVAFLNSLFPPNYWIVGGHRPSTPEVPARLPPDWHLAWDERAAVMEFDGGLPRERAEALALAEILDRMKSEDSTTEGESP